MIKRLIKHGNSLALVIDRSILELLEIEPDSPLSITTDGDCLIVTPIRDPVGRDRFRAALESVGLRHGRALKRLGG